MMKVRLDTTKLDALIASAGALEAKLRALGAGAELARQRLG